MARDDVRWFALWTQSHCEQLVREQLLGKGFDTFLPMIRTWSRRAGARRLIDVPMFPGYLFVHDAMGKRSYIEIMGTRGVVRLLGERWDRLASIDDSEIESLQRLRESELCLMPYPYLREGQRVRIMQGPLAGVEGILVRDKSSRGLLVLSVNLLNRSVAVEVDCATVMPVDSGFTRPTAGILSPIPCH